MKSSNAKSTVPGEDDYVSTRKYNERAQVFSQLGKDQQAAQDAVPRNAQKHADLCNTEIEGRAHAKGTTQSSQDDGSSPGRSKPDKQAPGRHPQGRKPSPEKFPGG